MGMIEFDIVEVRVVVSESRIDEQTGEHQRARIGAKRNEYDRKYGEEKSGTFHAVLERPLMRDEVWLSKCEGPQKPSVCAVS